MAPDLPPGARDLTSGNPDLRLLPDLGPALANVARRTPPLRRGARGRGPARPGARRVRRRCHPGRTTSRSSRAASTASNVSSRYTCASATGSVSRTRLRRVARSRTCARTRRRSASRSTTRGRCPSRWPARSRRGSRRSLLVPARRRTRSVRRSPRSRCRATAPPRGVSGPAGHRGRPRQRRGRRPGGRPSPAAGTRWAAVRSAAKALGPDLRVAVLAGDGGHGRQGPGTPAAGNRLGQPPAPASHRRRVCAGAAIDDGTLARASARTYGDRRRALLDALAAHDLDGARRQRPQRVDPGAPRRYRSCRACWPRVGGPGRRALPHRRRTGDPGHRRPGARRGRAAAPPTWPACSISGSGPAAVALPSRRDVHLPRPAAPPRARVVLLSGPSGSGKSSLAARVGLPTVCLDDFYRDGDDAGPAGRRPLGIVDWDDPASWDADRAVAALVRTGPPRPGRPARLRHPGQPGRRHGTRSTSAARAAGGGRGHLRRRTGRPVPRRRDPRRRAVPDPPPAW